MLSIAHLLKFLVSGVGGCVRIPTDISTYFVSSSLFLTEPSILLPTTRMTSGIATLAIAVMASLATSIQVLPLLPGSYSMTMDSRQVQVWRIAPTLSDRWRSDGTGTPRWNEQARHKYRTPLAPVTQHISAVPQSFGSDPCRLLGSPSSSLIDTARTSCAYGRRLPSHPPLGI